MSTIEAPSQPSLQLTSVVNNSPEFVQEAVQKSKQAQPHWAALSPKVRARYLLKAKDYIFDHQDHIVDVLQKDNGKPKVEAFSHDILSVLHALTWTCKNAPRRLKPKSIPMMLMKHKKSTIYYIPYGVVGIISPWNFPFAIPMGEVITALIAGNSVILKPSEVTPKVATVIQEVLSAMELPKDVFQMVEGGPDVGKALVSAHTDKIIFTGSSKTGQAVMHACVDQFKPYCMELGGKDAMVVMDDADLDGATSAALWGSMANAGQVCASVERLYVHETNYDAFEKLFLKKVNSLRVDDSTGMADIGRITYEHQKQTYDRHLKNAHEKGQVLAGGTLSTDRSQMVPTVVTGKEDLLCAQEETFGPLVYLQKFKTEEEVINKVNASDYGLLASVWSGSSEKANRVSKQLDVGTVIINDVLYTNAMTETPWGGRKASGFGHVHGDQGLMEMVYPLHIHEDRFGFLMKPFWWFPYGENQYRFLEGFSLLAYGKGIKRKWKGLMGLIKNLSYLWKEPRL
jgi:acyl-CoA reductase-like NAD-dependent aldehyde dehydrogenase